MFIAVAFLLQFVFAPVAAQAASLLGASRDNECSFRISITKTLDDGTPVELVETDGPVSEVTNEQKSSDPAVEKFLKNAHLLKFELLDENGDVLATAERDNDELVFSFNDECGKWSQNALPEGYTIREMGPDGEIYALKYSLDLSVIRGTKNVTGKLSIINPVPTDDTAIYFEKNWPNEEERPPVADLVLRVSVTDTDGTILDVPVKGENDWKTTAYFFKEDFEKFGENLENLDIIEDGPAGYVPSAFAPIDEDRPGNSRVVVSNLDEVTVVKNWVGDQLTDRPEEVVIYIKDGMTNQIVSDKVVMKPSTDSKDSWRVVVPIMPEAEISSANNLEVVEEPLSGYTTGPSKWDAEKNALIFINTKITDGGEKDVPVVKKWADENTEKPTSVTLSLLVKEKNSQEDFKVVSETTVSAPDWSGKFTNVPAEIGDVSKYEWKIKEQGAEGFVIDKMTFTDLQTGFTVVNNKSEFPQLIKDDHFAYMTGYPDGTFGPERYITRAEVTVMFSRLMVEKMHIGVKYPSKFPDVTADKWYADNIGHMENFNVVRGYVDGTFKPDQNVTRAEFAAIVSRFDKLTPSGKVNFADVPANHWAKEVIDSAVTKGWFGGYAGNIFKPDDPIKRSEVVAVVNRMIERQADLDFIKTHPSEIKHYTDLTDSYWAYADILEASNSHDFEKKAEKEIWLKIRPIV